MSNKDSQQSEEVDLGQLFKAIGSMFDRFFRFIGGIFAGIYKVVLMLMVHIYKRIKWYGASIIIGFVFGYIIDMGSEPIYGANMFIETNYNSARQVYENIKQLHQLASIDRDTVELGETLNISSNNAAKIKGFFIEPDLDENDIVKMYSDFYKRLDSISRLEMSYEKYKKSLTHYNFKIHRIGVASTDKMIFNKIQDEFITGLTKNEFLDNLVKSNIKILEKKDKTLSSQIKVTDSLVNEYLKIRVKESEKEAVPGSGTNLYMGNSESSGLIVDESKLALKRLSYENQRRKLDSLLVVKGDVVNVLAKFPYSGYDISKWSDKKKFTFPIFLFSFTLLVFIFIGLRKYLEEESNK